MDRRSFFGIGLAAVAVGVVSAFGNGCSRHEDAPAAPRGLGNEEKHWRMVEGSEKLNEPVDLPYAKNTAVVYRDASFGKEDPSFKPQVGGG
jgi:hypothetical protein